MPLTFPAFPLRAVFAPIVVGVGGIMVVTAVGHVERRAVPVAFLAALALDQLFLLAGASWDVSLRPAWLPVQLLLTAAGLGLLWLWWRMPEDDAAEGSLERRAGGLRLRGGLAFGAILFLQAVVGTAAVAARLTGVSYATAALVLVAGTASALALSLLGLEPDRAHRSGAAVLALVATAAASVTWRVGGWGALMLMGAGQMAALLLVGRALAPAGGRRRPASGAAGLTLWALLHALLASTFFPAQTQMLLHGAAPWVGGAAGLILLAAVLLLPRPERAPPVAVPAVALGAPAAVLAVAGLLAYLPSAQAGGEPERTDGEAPALLGSGATVATYNVHFGYDEDWTHDPTAAWRDLEESLPDLAALQEVPAGLPAAYGVDLAALLSRRTGRRVAFSATSGPLLGDALVLPGASPSPRSVVLPGEDPRQAQITELFLGGDTVRVIGTRLGLSDAARLRQAEALARLAGRGPAVLLGDLNAQAGDAALGVLAAAGFRDAFAIAGRDPAPTAPAREPARRIDWILVRGLDVAVARVLTGTASDHLPVTAELRPY